MDEAGQDSVTVWVQSLKRGDAEAAEKLWRRYFEGLIRLARARLQGMPRAVADEEDAALSAFDSFFEGAARGRYPKLDDRDDLGRWIVVITERKALDQTRREQRQKGGDGKILGTPALADEDGWGGGLAGVSSPEPTPEFAAQVADECGRLLGKLRDDGLRRTAQLKMEGYTNEEVAERMGCSLRSVARKLELIRRTWEGEEGAGP